MTTELTALFAVLLLAAILLMGILGGGLLWALMKISQSPAILRAAESGYERATEEKRALIDLTYTLLHLMERLAKEVVPTSDVTQAIDTAEDILREVTDGT